MSKKLSQLDANQVLRKAYNDETETLDISVANNLVPEEYDDIQLSYTGNDLTGVQYFNSGTLVAELELTYVGGNLTRARRV